MKSLIILSIMTSALITSACGSSSDKKKEEPHHFFHLSSDEGYCLEIDQEVLAAHGYAPGDETVAGVCPATALVQDVTASRYATCPYIDKDGVPSTAVVYSTTYNKKQDTLLDMTKFTPEAVCSMVTKNLAQ